MTLLIPVSAQAKVTYDKESNVLWIDGETTRKSRTEIEKVLTDNNPKFIMMQGPGGDFYSGLAIGYMLENYHVVITGQCASACAASALGARQISFLNKAQLMFHGPFVKMVPINFTFEEYSLYIVKAWIDFDIYLNNMGVSSQFTKHMSRNSNYCKLTIVETQEQLKMIKEDRYPSLPNRDFCAITR